VKEENMNMPKEDQDVKDVRTEKNPYKKLLCRIYKAVSVFKSI